MRLPYHLDAISGHNQDGFENRLPGFNNLSLVMTVVMFVVMVVSMTIMRMFVRVIRMGMIA